MADELNVTQNAGRCAKLLCKGMYTNAGLPPGEQATGDGDFWCGTTQTVYGPDDELCDGESCRDSARSCHEAT